MAWAFPAPRLPQQSPQEAQGKPFQGGRHLWGAAGIQAGETVTAGAHCVVNVPIEIANKAIEFGHAVQVNSPVAQPLRALQDPDYSPQLAWDCVDLSLPKPAPKPPDERAMAPVVHSGIVGQARTGTAPARGFPA